MGIYYWCGEVRIKPEAAQEVQSLIAHHGLGECVRVWRGEEGAVVVVSGDSYGWDTCERIDTLLGDVAARGLLADEVTFVPFQFDTTRGYLVLRNGHRFVTSVDTGALVVDAPDLPPGEHTIPIRVIADGRGRAILLPPDLATGPTRL